MRLGFWGSIGKKLVALAIAAAACSFASGSAALAQEPATTTVHNEVSGKSPVLIGYGQGHYMPGSNVSAWLQRSGANSLRIFMNATYFAPQDDMAPFGDGVTDAASFEARRAAVIADPENPTYINWSYYENNFNNVQTRGNVYNLAYMMGELKRLGITPIVNTQHCSVNNATTKTNPRDWRKVSHSPSWMPISIHNDYAEKWEYWKWQFVSTYWLAKNFDVTDYQLWNEPDHVQLGGNISQDDYMEWVRYGSDAKRAAIQAVNAKYGKNLKAKIYAPVITSPKAFSARLDNTDTRDDVTGWGQRIAQGLHTDYKGETVSYNIVDVFDIHRYRDDAYVYADEMAEMQEGMKANTPDGSVLPINFSEQNVENTSTFEKTGDDLDMPLLFTDQALIYARTMERGVYGIQSFKYSNVDGSNVGFQFTANGPANFDTGGYRKGASVVKLFAKGFTQGRDLYRTTTLNLPATQNSGFVSSDGVNYYVWSVNTSDSSACALQFNLAEVDVNPNSPITVEEVSAERNGEVVIRDTAHAGKSLQFTQPKQSVWLISIPRGGKTKTVALDSIADAQVQGGAAAAQNFGSADSMQVQKGASVESDRISYLKFDLTSTNKKEVSSAKKVQRAILNIYGWNGIDIQPFAFHLYGITDNTWSEDGINWLNAPAHDPSGAKATGVGTISFPLGVMTLQGAPGYARIDVTDFVNRQIAVGRSVSFMLIKENRFEGDTSDQSRRAAINTRESKANRPTLTIDYQEDTSTPGH